MHRQHQLRYLDGILALVCLVFIVRNHRTFRSKDKYGDRISPSGEAWVSRRITCFDQLTLCFKFSKYFPVYISVRVQGYMVHFGEFLGTPKGPESGR